MTTYFISDLHLDESRPEVTATFFSLLKQWRGNCDALYILGDFFEVWVGDDDDAPLCCEVIKQLQHFSQSGAQLFFMHGNRDFLIGDAFCQATGATLLPDPSTIELYGDNVLVMHGDSLCTDDREYMTFRKQARDPQWQQQILSQPLAARKAFAKQLREQSQSMNAIKADDIMDVNATEVIRVLKEFDVKRLIHGHTHRPNRHQINTEQLTAERIVLGDWCSQAWILEVTKDNYSLFTMPLISFNTD